MTSPAKEKLNLAGYKTNVGLFITISGHSYYSPQIAGYKYNGKENVAVKVSGNYYWLKDIQEIVSVEKKLPAAHKLLHYKLINSKYESPAIPATLPASINVYDEDEELHTWGEYEGFKGLYEGVYEVLPERWVEMDVEFTLQRNGRDIERILGWVDGCY